MKKIISLIIIATLILTGIFFYAAKFSKNNSPKDSNTILSQEIEKQQNQVIQVNSQDQIDVLRNRFSLKWILMKGDNYFENNQLILALSEYLKAYAKSPNDLKIISKIADVYFELKNYPKTEEFLLKIPAKTPDQMDKLIVSMMSQIDLTDYDGIKLTANKIKNLNLNPEEQFYYMNTLNCSVNFHECKKYFENYFKKNPNITFSKLKNIQTALQNFKNFQTENISYKDALIIGAFYQDKLYNISTFLWENLLKTTPKYKPILLMVGKGHYELGNTSLAQKALLEYYNLDPKEINIAYLLWNLYFKQRDYAASSLYYNVALRNGFFPKIELQRKLIYNYYLVGDKRSMLNIFSYLLDEPESTIEDYSLWIYHAILSNKQANAKIWAERGIKKFTQQNGVEVFYGYLGWIERESGSLKKAEEYIQDGLTINPRNPLLTLNSGYIEKAKKNMPLAMIYFKRTVNLNGEGEFWELAQKEILELETLLQTQSWAIQENKRN